MSRFDYIKYDEKAAEQQAAFKGNFQSLEGFVESALISPRAKALALTKLEEAYMWVGKAIRDDQIQRISSRLTVELQEQRTNS
jgi:hypothetical protein